MKKLQRGRIGAFAAVFAVTAAMWSGVFDARASAIQPELQRTAVVERLFLQGLIDHHYAALRLTELAVGTEMGAPGSAIDPNEQTSGSPTFPQTAGRAVSARVKSLARKNNRIQREEILHAQTMLHDLYGIDHVPQLTADGVCMINRLSQVPAGQGFDDTFLRTMTLHHYLALKPVTDCLTGLDTSHSELERCCRGLLDRQLNEIDEMRHMLCEDFNDCEYIPR